MRHLFVSFAAAITLTGCVPDTGTGRGTSSGSQTSCSIIRPSAPYGIKGPNPDGANFYRFTVRADGEVTCTGKVAQIGVTVVLHHSTNGVAGAHTGPTTLCPNTRECAAHADFLRQRLYCKEVYHYADSGQV